MVTGVLVGLITAAVLGAIALAGRRWRRRSTTRQPIRITFERAVRAPWGVALPGTLPDPAQFEARRDVGERDAYDWLQSVGAVDHGETKLRLFLVGNGDAPVLIRSMRVVSSRHEPYRATLVECATAGALSSTMLLFDLDDEAPAAWEAVQPEFELPSRVGNAPYFDRTTIELAPGEHHDLLIVGTANRFRVEWSLEVDVMVQGTKTTIHVDDNGKPFTTNGLLRDDYHEVLEWNWYEPPPHFGPPPSYE